MLKIHTDLDLGGGARIRNHPPAVEPGDLATLQDVEGAISQIALGTGYKTESPPALKILKNWFDAGDGKTIIVEGEEVVDWQNKVGEDSAISVALKDAPLLKDNYFSFLNGDRILEFEQLRLSGNQSFTLAFSLRVNKDNGNQQLIKFSQGGGNNNELGANFKTENDQLLFQLGGNIPQTSNGVLADFYSRWISYVISYDGSKFSVWLDNTSVISQLLPLAQNFNSSVPTYLATYNPQNSGSFFKGDIKEILFYPECLTTRDRTILHNYLASSFIGKRLRTVPEAQNAVPRNNVLAHWELEETKGRRKDSSGNYHTMTVNDNSKVVSVTGKVGTNAVSMNSGTNGYLETNGIDFKTTTSFTIAGWIQVEVNNNNIILLSKGVFSLTFFLISNRFLFRVGYENPATISASVYSQVVPQNNTWHFFVLTHDAAKKEIAISIDGEVPQKQTYTDSPREDPSLLFIVGNLVSGGTASNRGKRSFDDIFWCDWVLNATEIQNIRARGS